MGRLLLNYLLPLALPLTIYLVYAWWRRYRANKHSTDTPAFEQNYIFISILIGFVLMIGSMTWVAVNFGESPGLGDYKSPSYQGGKIIPPSFK